MVEEKEVILGEKIIHKNAMFVWANSRSIIPFKDSIFFLEIKPINDKFNAILLKTKGIKTNVAYKTFVRPRKTIVKAKSLIPETPTSQITLKEKIEQEELI